MSDIKEKIKKIREEETSEEVNTKKESDNSDEALAKLLDLIVAQEDPDLASEARRKLIEKELPDIDIGDLIIKGTVKQVVKCGPVEFEFRHPSSAEDLYIKRRISQIEYQGPYLVELFGVLNAAICLVRINDHVLPKHYEIKEDGTVEVISSQFDKKLNEMLQYPRVLLLDAIIQSQWFQQRVWKQYIKYTNPEELKNG